GRHPSVGPGQAAHADDKFVAECERIISAQNEAWMAKLSSDPGQPAKPAPLGEDANGSFPRPCSAEPYPGTSGRQGRTSIDPLGGPLPPPQRTRGRPQVPDQGDGLTPPALCTILCTRLGEIERNDRDARQLPWTRARQLPRAGSMREN